MQIKELATKYKLDPKVDFWKHKQSGKWIITHDACEKISSIENIVMTDWKTLNSERDFCRFLITMSKGDKTITSIGEASKDNCQSRYYGMMGEKRGIDRCILKLINAYEYGIYSDSEADNFKKPTEEVKVAPIPATQKQKKLIMDLEVQANVKRHIEFEGLTKNKASEYIDKLNNRIRGNENG